MRRAFVVLVVVIVGVGWGCTESSSDRPHLPRTPETLTFSKDIAPIIFKNCSVCHRPGEGAPFSLLTYRDVRTRSRQITVVTESRYMPPWLPSDGHEEFAGKRQLTRNEIGIIGQWVKEGKKEGNPGDLPPTPTWPEGWTLGTPDLVIELPEAYDVPADGPDVYRNFVLKVPHNKRAYVRALEFNPDNRRVAHHAIVYLDRKGTARRLDEESPGPGFGGADDMTLPDPRPSCTSRQAVLYKSPANLCLPCRRCLPYRQRQTTPTRQTDLPSDRSYELRAHRNHQIRGPRGVGDEG